MNKLKQMISDATKDSSEEVNVKNITSNIKRIYPKEDVTEQQVRDFIEEEFFYEELGKRYSKDEGGFY